MKINIFWFRRDLRTEDNMALNRALSSDLPVLPVFIFDTNITDELPADDPRVGFIHERLSDINKNLRKSGSSLYVLKGDPEEKWKELVASFDVNAVYINKDYEPYDTMRDKEIEELLKKSGIRLFRFKDQVIFEEEEILKPDDKPYTIFTPYKNRWLKVLNENISVINPVKVKESNNFFQCSYAFPALQEAGFRRSSIRVRPFDLSVIPDYHIYRNIPSADKTSYLSPHLRFGTVSIRNIVKTALIQNMSFLSELVWREFFMQILFHYPNVITDNFRPVYDDIRWRNDEKEFQRWCSGETGYPIVDAGMRQLNLTGYMHNRVRMITAGFLCKHLLIDWRRGETYFAQKLLDYELSSNNGNWQWAAGTGCDAAPYFRIFNPMAQQKKFDPGKEYIRKWIDNSDLPGYPEKMVDHEFARQRALTVYKAGIKRKIKDF
jgi:deoxyribodipyrimidine photo-lyase